MTMSAFNSDLDDHLAELHQQFHHGTYQPLPILGGYIPKAGNVTKIRPPVSLLFGIGSCKRPCCSRMEPVFASDWDDASFGYRMGRPRKDVLGKVWREDQAGSQWIVVADLSS